MLVITFCVSQTGIPKRSKVFLPWSKFVASIISVAVTGESERLNKGMSSLLRMASGGWSDGLISLTIAEDTEVKNILKWLAISSGLLIERLL